MIKTFFVQEPESGERADLFLQSKFKNFSRNQIQSLIENNHAKINNKPLKSSHKLKTGEEIEVETIYLEKLSDPIKIIAENIPLEIIYEDDNLLAINKPAGLVVHPAHGNTTGTLVNALIDSNPEILELADDESSQRPGIIHRLDKDTSGIILVAKTEIALTSISEQIKKHKAKKTYLALVFGSTEKSGTVESYIARNKNDRKKMAETSESQGKLAITNFRKVEEFLHNGQQLSYLEIMIPTGRTHQIRLQMKSIGHPIIGDQTYFDKNSKKISDDLGIKRQLLHASKIKFCLPGDNKELELESDLADDFKKILTRLS